eukprot:GHVP01040818.1.p1 GENE.GHVP01040818.1~~GHVP01040818.1.p1  ORF type:complete len:241 (-),score=38.06 GHVP01040818.1:172-894(-)
MEFKILSDQLNSACQDIVFPQANGFTVQDELHQANSSEPTFWGVGLKDKVYTCISNPKSTLEKENQMAARTKYILTTIQDEFCQKKRLFLMKYENAKNYEENIVNKKAFDAWIDSVKKRNWKLSAINSTRTEEDGRLFWSIEFWDTKKHKFLISWKRGLSEESNKTACKRLMLTFDDNSGYFGLDNIFDDNASPQLQRQGEEAERSWLKNKFEPLWKEFRKPTRSEECSDSPSEEPTPAK